MKTVGVSEGNKYIRQTKFYSKHLQSDQVIIVDWVSYFVWGKTH